MPTTTARRINILDLLLLASLSAPHLAGAQGYQVLDLGTPGGFTNTSGAYSGAHGINAAGSVAGEWAPNNTEQRAFFYVNGSNTDLGSLSGMSYAIAYGVNNSNVVVGLATDYLFTTRAFVYTNGAMVALSAVTNPYSIAHAINDAGLIVGESVVAVVAAKEVVHAVIFQGGGQQTDLGTLSTGDYSSAMGINNSNVIVGLSTVISGSVTNVNAFTYSNGVMSNLGTLPGGNYSSAFGINDAGQIVGEAANSNGNIHAFLYHGAMTDLGTLGGNNSSATAINSAGQVVGYALTTNGNQHAFLYNGSTMLDLNNLIPSSSVFTNLISGDGINNLGQITGWGQTTNGETHAFLLTPTLQLASPQALANGQFQVTIQGVPGEHFALLVSSNLSNWTSLATNTLAGSSTNWVDTTAPSYNYRFYRALLLP